MTITPEQARARLEQKPDASRVERRAYSTIAGMTYEYAVQYKNDDGQWEWTYEEWNNRWQNSYITQEIRALRDHPGEDTRIVRRLVSKPEEIS